MQTQANPTITAITQLCVFAITVAAVVVLAVTHAIGQSAVEALAGAAIAHGGIIGYNGATKGTGQGGTPGR